MPAYSLASKRKLATCHPSLILVFDEVIKYFDHTILEGHRGQEEQDKAYREGKSKLKWPNGNHNAYPSNAVDAIPFPVDWNDRERMSLFAGFVLGTAKQLGVNLRWGGDWDGDMLVKDNSFDDLVHFELRK